MPKRCRRISPIAFASWIAYACMILASVASSPAVLFAEEGSFTIDIAPRVIELEDPAFQWLTIRTTVPYRSVHKDMPVVLSLDGGENTVSARTTSQDAGGNLVARFAAQEVKNFLNLKIGKENTFILECFSVNGDALMGKQGVSVVRRK